MEWDSTKFWTKLVLSEKKKAEDKIKNNTNLSKVDNRLARLRIKECEQIIDFILNN